MAWILLFCAGLFEIVWAIGMKYTDGFTRLYPTILTVSSMIVSFTLLGLSMKYLPLGTAYAIWTGIGTIGAVIAGAIIFHEHLTPIRIVCIMLIISGIAGLKISTPVA